MSDIARSLDREDEAVRNLRRPFAKGRRRLCPIKSAVDLDRGEAARCVAELLRMRQAIRVERAPPRRKGPTADANVDMFGDLLGFGHGILSLEHFTITLSISWRSHGRARPGHPRLTRGAAARKTWMPATSAGMTRG